MSVLSSIKMTARQFQQLGEDPPGVRLELVNGEIVVSPSPTPAHSYADKQLSTLLNNHIAAHNLGFLFGDVDTIFGENDVRRPDLIFFSHKRAHLIGGGAIEGPPDLCVEIISPNSGTTDRVDKYDQYEAGGVLHYWLLDPAARTLEGYKLRRGKFVATGSGKGEQTVSLPPFEDLKIPLAQLWLKLPPRPPRRRR